MEAINVLESKPKGIKLFDSVVGECVIFDRVEDNHIICSYNGNTQSYKGNGKIFDNKDAIVVLNPSKSMHDWSKFAWKKGDVLFSNNTLVVFNRFVNDDYTDFEAAFEGYQNEIYDEGNIFFTDDFSKATDDGAKDFIKNIEEHYGGKLNLSTLEIEKPSEFKDGDIVFYEDSEHEEICSSIFIFRGKQNHTPRFLYHAVLASDGFFNAKDGSFGIYEGKLRPATDSEKQQLFDALAKENKAWDAEKKQIVDLPKKCEFKPMDWCLMRMHRCIWMLCQYSSKSDEWSCPYIAVGGNAYEECIPYTDQTAHLLGTTDDWKGGEE